MKLYINTCERDGKKIYWIDVDHIDVNNNYLFTNDNDIAKLIGISTKQYRIELLQFITDSNDYNYIGSDIVFTHSEMATKVLNYLIDEYGVLLALTT